MPLVQATQVAGAFGAITVKHKGGGGGGKCHEDFVSSTDYSRGSLSVLITSRETPCKQAGPGAVLMTVIFVFVLGATAVVLGLLYVRREAAMTWARATTQDDVALVT